MKITLLQIVFWFAIIVVIFGIAVVGLSRDEKRIKELEDLNKK